MGGCLEGVWPVRVWGTLAGLLFSAVQSYVP